jgi:MarR family transcriptional regulator, transcriptional regulator for hemolysin
MTSECPTCLSSDLAWLLSQAHYTLANEVTAAIEPLGISMREFQVLKTAINGEYTQKDLADLVGLDKTTMVATIDDLEEAGLAVRRPSDRDRRARVISVTAAGKRKVAQGRDVVERVQQDVLRTLPAAQREGFLEGLGRLVREGLTTPVECKRPVRRRRAA